jgi:hypothetical protein
LIQTSCHKHNHTSSCLASLALPAVLHFCVGGFYGFIWPMMSGIAFHMCHISFPCLQSLIVSLLQ